MLEFPRWKVEVTVDGNPLRVFYETATTSASAIGKVKHKMRGSVSNAGAFRFKAKKVAAMGADDLGPLSTSLPKSNRQLDAEIKQIVQHGERYTPAQRAAQVEIKLDAIPFREWSRGRVIAILQGEDIPTLRKLQDLHLSGSGVFTPGRQVVRWIDEILRERGA